MATMVKFTIPGEGGALYVNVDRIAYFWGDREGCTHLQFDGAEKRIVAEGLADVASEIAAAKT